jgi:hypothetical protein
MENPAKGKITKVVAFGTTPPTSAEILIRLDDTYSFFVFADTPKLKFSELAKTAFDAMWSGNVVAVTWHPVKNNMEVTNITIVA